MDDSVQSPKLGTKRMPAVDLVAKGRHHVACLQNNAAFPNPTPSLPVISAACEKLDLAQQVYGFQGGKRELAARNTAYRELTARLRELKAYVTNQCHGRADLILSAGFDLRGKRRPPQPISAPQNLRAIFNREPGRIDLRWDAVKWRRVYAVFRVLHGPEGQEELVRFSQSPKNFLTLRDQPTGIHCFRVQAIGAWGEGPMSDLCLARSL